MSAYFELQIIENGATFHLYSVEQLQEYLKEFSLDFDKAINDELLGNEFNLFFCYPSASQLREASKQRRSVKIEDYQTVLLDSFAEVDVLEYLL